MKKRVSARLSYTFADDPFFRRLLISSLEYATGRRLLEKRYNKIRAMVLLPGMIWETVLNSLNIQVQYDAFQLKKIPKDGPLVFIANHPFGVVDGLILGHLVSRVRREFTVLVNEVLCREALFEDHFLPIDFRETKTALLTNIQTRRMALDRLRNGQALAIFPAGGVATAVNPWGKAQDLEWKRFAAKVIQQTGATVVPLFMHGQNSRLFQIASRLNMNLRLGLLLNEVRNKMGRKIRVSIGEPIPFESYSAIRDRQVLLNWLREKTFELEKQ